MWRPALPTVPHTSTPVPKLRRRMSKELTQYDNAKFAYHEGARLIRTVQDRICELTYAGASLDHDEHEALCDMLIELHQLLYNVTLFTIRDRDPEDDGTYSHDEVYADGRPAVSRIYLPADSNQQRIPASAYRSD